VIGLADEGGWVVAAFVVLSRAFPDGERPVMRLCKVPVAPYKYPRRCGSWRLAENADRQDQRFQLRSLS
jgi:hypothetical protein